MKNTFGSFLLAALVASTGAACVVEGHAHVRTPPPPVAHVEIEVEEAPPPPRTVVVETRPGFIWVEGRWARRGHNWVWVDGRWERERVGYVWSQGRWERRGNRHVWVEGRWAARGGGGGPPGHDVRDHRKDKDRDNGPVIRDHRR
jgi:hypothetical protein